MGLSTDLGDISNDSIPLLLIVSTAAWLSHLRSLLLCFLHTLGLIRLHSINPPLCSTLGSGLAALTERLRSCPAFTYVAERDCIRSAGCVVCMTALGDGDRSRRLPCSHMFHAECIDGWFDEMKLSCPLCRSPVVAEERRAETERRVGAEMVAWFSRYQTGREGLWG